MNPFHLLLAVIILTLAFEFSNGWHDAANSIATVVSTRVLTPFRAVAWAAFWNFIAAFVFGTAVAKTIGKGMVHIELVDQQVLLAGLLGAIGWNLITLILGLPTSSSHALMGGYGGAVLEFLNQKQIATPVVRIGWPDQFIEHGAVPILRKKHGITADALVEKVLPLLRKKSSLRPSVA